MVIVRQRRIQKQSKTLWPSLNAKKTDNSIVSWKLEVFEAEVGIPTLLKFRLGLGRVMESGPLQCSGLM